MIINARYRNRVSNAVEQVASRLLRGRADSCPDDDGGGDTAEICRMIELSGMISLECDLLGGE